MKELKHILSKDSSDYYPNLSGTLSSESYRNDEDENLLSNPDLQKINNQKETFIGGIESFTDKYQYNQSNNQLCKYLMTKNISLFLIMNIISLVIILISFIIKFCFILYKIKTTSYKIISFLIFLVTIFQFCSLIKYISFYRDYIDKKITRNENEIIMIILQKWNLFYSICILIFSLSIFFSILREDMYFFQNISWIKLLELILQIITLLILSLIYYGGNLNKNVAINMSGSLFNLIAIPFSFSSLLSFVLIIIINSLTYSFFINLNYLKNSFFIFMTCVAILVMVYRYDFILPIFNIIYQLANTDQMFDFSINIQKICVILNLCLIVIFFKKMIDNEQNVNDDEYNPIKDSIRED